MQRQLILIMAFMLPVWLVIGRAVLGSIGWLTIVYIFTVVPVLFGALLLIYFLARKLTITLPDQQLLYTLYASLLLHGFFLVDGGDTEDSVGSVASNLFGSSFEGPSMLIAVLTLFLSVILLVIITIRLGAQRFSRPKQPPA